jgi:outer membrane protein
MAMPAGLAAVLAVALAGTLAAAPARAAGLRIAVVNYSELLQESPQAQAAVAKLRAEFAPKQRSLQSEANELKVREDNLKKNEATMTQDQRDQAQLDLRERYQDLARKQSEIQDDVNTRRNELMSQLQRTLVQVVQNYAKQQRYDLVLADGVIYSDAGLDITPAILSALKSQAGHPALHR